jgi:hypothetical protein
LVKKCCLEILRTEPRLVEISTRNVVNIG